MRRQREQWLTEAEIAALRVRRTMAVLERARAAQYYKGILSGISPLDADYPLRNVPMLNKSTMREFGEAAFLTDGDDGLVPVYTSGSTGHPARFLRSPAEEAEFSSRWYRVHAAYGGGFRDAIVNIGTTGKKSRRGPATLLRALGILPAVRTVSVTSPAIELVQIVRDMEPQFVVGYAVGIENIASYVVSQGIKLKSPKAVLCGAMDVTDHCHELVERAFNAPAVNVYATNEFGVIGWECPTRRGALHVNEDSLVMEIVDESGRTVPDGTTGEVVLTSLTLGRMPLIRYRTGDLAARIPEKCACGRGLPLMTKVQGRTSHAIVGPQGELITAPMIAGAITAASAYQWVRRFQLREQENNILQLLVQPACDPLPSQVDALQTQLKQAVGASFTVELQLRDDLPLAPTGKYQHVVPLPAQGHAAVSPNEAAS
jgi:phenylacetate-CoA ligase